MRMGGQKNLGGYIKEISLIPENELLFICARKNFQPSHQKAIFELCDKFEIKWDVVHLTALQHQIAPLIDSNFQCLFLQWFTMRTSYLT